MSRIVRMATLLTLLTVPAWAGGLGVGVSSWDTSDASDDLGLGVKIELDLGQWFDLELRGAWLDSLDFSAQGRNFKLEATPIDVGLGYDFRVGEKIEPYVGAGFSFVLLNGKQSGPGAVRVDDESGYYAVVGLEGGVHQRLSLFGEVLYREVSATFASDGLTRDFADFGVDLGGVAANVGVKLGW